MPLAMHDAQSTPRSWASHSPHSSQLEPTCTIACRSGTTLEVQIEPGVSPLNPAFLEYLSTSLRTPVGGLVEEDTGVLATSCRPGKAYIAVSNLADATQYQQSSPSSDGPLKGHLEAKLEQLHQYQPKRGDTPDGSPPTSTSFGNTSPTLLNSSQILAQMAKNVSPTSALTGLASIEKKRLQLLETIQRQKEQAYQVEQFASRTRMDSRQQTYYNELNRSLQLNQLQLQQLEATAVALEQELGMSAGKNTYPSTNTSTHQSYRAESESTLSGSYAPSPAIPTPAIAPAASPPPAAPSAFSTALQAFHAHVASLLPPGAAYSPTAPQAPHNGQNMPSTGVAGGGLGSGSGARSGGYGEGGGERALTPPARRSLLLGLEKIPTSETIPMHRVNNTPKQQRSKSPSNFLAKRGKTGTPRRPEWKYFASNKPVREAPPTWHEVALPDIDHGREGMPEMLKLTNGKIGARETNLWAQGLREHQRVHGVPKNRPRTPRAGDYSDLRGLM